MARVHPAHLATTAVLYAVVAGELLFRDDRQAYAASAGCFSGPPRPYGQLAVGAGIAIYLVSTVVLALRARRLGGLGVGVHAAVALLGGMGGGALYLAWRERTPLSHCPRLALCGPNCWTPVSPIVSVAFDAVIVLAAGFLAIQLAAFVRAWSLPDDSRPEGS